MPVSAKDVERVAELANLELSSVEKTTMLRDLNSVLDYIATLNQLDTTAVPAMEQVVHPRADGAQVAAEQSLRADEVAPSLKRQPVLASAPDTDGVFFKVPKVLDR